MPPRKKKDTEQAPKPHTQRYWLETDAAWGGFINIRFDDERAELFRAWLRGDGKDYARLVDDLIGAGAKVTLAYDEENQCYIVSVAGALCTEQPKFRFSTSSRAGSMAEALAMAVYKHYFIAEGDYTPFRPTKIGNGMNWG